MVSFAKNIGIVAAIFSVARAASYVVSIDYNEYLDVYYHFDNSNITVEASLNGIIVNAPNCESLNDGMIVVARDGEKDNNLLVTWNSSQVFHLQHNGVDLLWSESRTLYCGLPPAASSALASPSRPPQTSGRNTSVSLGTSTISTGAPFGNVSYSISTFTTTISGVVTVTTTYCPIPVIPTSEVVVYPTITSKSVLTTYTQTLTVTHCNDHACTATTRLVPVTVTKTIEVPCETSSTGPAPVPSIPPVVPTTDKDITRTITHVTTITKCIDGHCGTTLETSTSIVKPSTVPPKPVPTSCVPPGAVIPGIPVPESHQKTTVTTTISGVVTKYTTYCPPVTTKLPPAIPTVPVPPVSSPLPAPPASPPVSVPPVSSPLPAPPVSLPVPLPPISSPPAPPASTVPKPSTVSISTPHVIIISDNTTTQTNTIAFPPTLESTPSSVPPSTSPAKVSTTAQPVSSPVPPATPSVPITTISRAAAGKLGSSFAACLIALLATFV